MITNCPRSAPPKANPLRSLSTRRWRSGIMLVEMLVATGLVAVVIGSSLIGMLQANREAAAYRALTAARIVVERNIEYALAVSFDSTTTPTILQITSATGAVYDDDGGGDNLVNLLVQNA